MTDENQTPTDDFMPAKVVYGLYILGYFIPFASLGGLIYAYITRGQNPVVDTHLTFQIRTFWISLLIGLIGLITLLIGIGFLIILFLIVWGLVRVVSGFVLANERKPITGTKYLGVLAY